MSTNVANLILEIIGKDTSGSKVLKDVGTEAETTGEKLKKFGGHMQTASIAVSGAGVGLEALARSQQESNVAVGQNAAMIGVSEGEYRKLATSIANAGFPLEEVNALIRTGAQEGIEGNDQLKKYAEFWDDVGDATGLSATALAEGATGLRAVGIAAGEEGEALAALGFITENTKVGADGFLELLTKKGANLREFGIDINDTAAVLGVMERELGLTGRAASTEFAAALDKSDGSMESLLAELGIAPEAFAAMRQEVDASSGVIERNAAIQDKTITSTQKWKQSLDEFLFTHAGVVKGLAEFAPIMMAAGPAVNGFAGAMRLVGPASTMAATGLRSVGMALLTPPLGIIIALVAVGVAVWIFRDEIVGAISDMWETVGPILTTARDFIVGAFDTVLEFGRNNWPEIVTLISGPFFPIVALATDAFGVRSAITGAFNTVLDFMRGNWPEVVTLLSGPFIPFVALATDAFGVRSALVGAFNAVLDFFRGEWVGNIVGFFTGLPGRIAGAMGDVKNLLWNKGKDLVQGMVNGMLSVNIPNPLGMIPGAGKVGGAIGKIPGLATGGPVAANQVYLVGEKGAELFVPESAGQIISNEQMKALSMGGTTSAVSVGQPLARKLVADFASIAPQASSAIEKYFGFIVTEAQKNFLAGEAASGDWMNDWLSHIEDPEVRAKAMQAGKVLSKRIEEGVDIGLAQAAASAQAGIAAIAATMNTAAQAVAGAAAGSTISWSTGVPRVVPAAPAGGGGGNANNNAIGLRAVRGPSGGVADSRAAPPVNVTMQNVTINSPKDAQTAANDVAFVIAANLRARGMMVPA